MMSYNLKNIVQEMIDKGYSENEIAIEIKKYQNQRKSVIEENKTTPKKSDKKDIVSKILAFIVVGVSVWHLIMLICVGISELINKPLDDHNIVITMLIVALISIYPSCKAYSYTSYENTLKKIVNSKLSTYVLELVFPIILTSLFYLLIESKDISEGDAIAGLVSFLFFFILVLEWIRRKKDKTERAYYFKYLYIGLMLLVFVLGVWYANELVIDY